MKHLDIPFPDDPYDEMAAAAVAEERPIGSRRFACGKEKLACDRAKEIPQAEKALSGRRRWPSSLAHQLPRRFFRRKSRRRLAARCPLSRVGPSSTNKVGNKSASQSTAPFRSSGVDGS
jgi:hypothetical protein